MLPPPLMPPLESSELLTAVLGTTHLSPMPHSHHSHSGQFCRHAKDSLADVVAEAERKGFTTFGLSEHCPRYREVDLFPEEADMTPEDLWTTYEAFLVEAKRLRSVSKISLLIGVETDYITDLDFDGLDRLLKEHEDIDYVVGSVHHVNGVSIDFDRDTWLRCVATAAEGRIGTTCATVDGSVQLVHEKAGEPTEEQVDKFLEAYFDAQYAMLQRHKPEVVGHIDLCLLWIPQTKLTKVWEKVRRNVEFAISYGALFEANAAAIRKGWTTSYPSRDVLKLILEKGGRICLSDDSHGVSYVGLNYGKMREYLVSEGVGEVWYLVSREQRAKGDEEIGDRRRVVARPLRGWAEDPFWETVNK